MAPRTVSSARAARTAKKGRPTQRRWTKPIDYSDIPALTTAELASSVRARAQRPGRPPLGATAKQAIALRLDPRVLAAFRKEAKRRGVGYQTLIHEVLERHVAKKSSAA